MISGKVKFFNVEKGYGFLTDSIQDAFIHRSVVEKAGIATLVAEEEVEYEIGTRADGKIQVSHVSLKNKPESSSSPSQGPGYSSAMGQTRTSSLEPLPPAPGLSRRPNIELYNWAYMWYDDRGDPSNIPSALRDLQGMARPERWSFGSEAENGMPKFPEILFNYLIYTFYRLKIEQKVLVSELNGKPIAAFNTGLVDRRFEPIYATFEPNPRPDRRFWKLSGFCVSSEGLLGKNLVGAFRDLPREATYFDNINDLIFDTKNRNEIEFDKRHVVLDNIDRFPISFLEDNLPPNFDGSLQADMSSEQRRSYFDDLASAISAHDRTYRSIVNRVRDAIELAVKRIRWNFKTAIPQYYPVINRLSLLLPLALQSDESADVALVVERTPAGSYLGHTILTLPMAYKNARLICRPDSDWLTPDQMTSQPTVASLEDDEETA